MYRREFRKIIRNTKKELPKGFGVGKKKKKPMQKRRETKTLQGSANFISKG